MTSELIIFSLNDQPAIADRLEALAFTHYSSQLKDKIFEDEKELLHAIYKAIDALAAAGLPVHRHFRGIYICEEGQLKQDFLVTDLGFRLIIVQADAATPAVARLKVEALLNHLI